MKFFRICCLILALLMIGGAMVACGSGTETKATETDETEKQVERDPVNVNIIVRASKDGENVYESGANGYDYEGDVLTVQEILIEFMSFDYSIDVEIDDSGKLTKIGDLEASASQFWLFSIAKHPKGADQAEPVEVNIDEYDDIDNGDTIVIYLS